MIVMYSTSRDEKHAGRKVGDQKMKITKQKLKEIIAEEYAKVKAERASEASTVDSPEETQGIDVLQEQSDEQEGQ